MGTIRKRGKSWYIDYRVNGKRIVKRIGKSKEIAELALKDVEVKIAKGRAGFVTEYKISDWLREFYRHIEAYLQPSTVTRYQDAMRWFTEFLKTLPQEPVYLTEITPTILEEYKLLRMGKVKNKTINNELSTIRRFFNLAIKRGYVEHNLLDRVEFLKLTDRKIPRFFSNEELQKIYPELAGEDRDIVRILANTGMRWGELRHLEWRDVNMDKKVIKIREKILHTGRTWKPKTGSEREVPMTILSTVYYP